LAICDGTQLFFGECDWMDILETLAAWLFGCVVGLWLADFSGPAPDLWLTDDHHCLG